MSDISASAVSSLRARTGVSILACKQALEEAGGDEEKAIELLRKRGVAQAAKKADRAQGEGLIFLAENDAAAALVMLMCETDFVARDDAFQEAGNTLATTLLNEGEDGLKSKAEEVVPALVQKLGENISLGEFVKVEAATIGSYLHSNKKIGVVVGLSSGSAEQARDVAMHAAAMNPAVVRPSEVNDELLSKERELWTEQLQKEGKPAEIMEKIMGGKEKKFREEQSLLTQAFVKNGEQTIEQYLGGDTIATYVRLSI